LAGGKVVRLAQCLEIGVASQGESEDEALTNLTEALELYFEPSTATRFPEGCTAQAEGGTA